MKDDLREDIELARGVTAQFEEGKLFVKGSKGEVRRVFLHPKIKVITEKDKIILLAVKATKREKTILGSFQSHIKNMIHGVQENHVYRLKICSGHFPMNVAISGKEFVVKNFLGETVPRKVQVIDNVSIKINGSEIIVSSSDVEAAGQMASKIENLCRITNRDRRIFQDGCYIVEKPA